MTRGAVRGYVYLICSALIMLVSYIYCFLQTITNHLLTTAFFFLCKVYHLKTDKTAAMGRKLAMAKENHQVFFMTPQILLNNINSKQISLQEVSLLILDECHHTRKREPYNNVMKQYLHLKRDSKKTALPQVGAPNLSSYLI